MTVLRLGMGEPGCSSPFLPWEKGKFPLLMELVQLHWAHKEDLCLHQLHIVSQLPLLPPPMDGGVWKEPCKVPLRLLGCRDGRAESLACDKPGVASALSMCIAPAFSSPGPPSLGSQHHWSGMGNSSLAAHWEKQGWPCCALPESLSLQGMAHVQIQGAELGGKTGTVQLDSAEMQWSYQCKLTSFYLSMQHQADASPMVLLLRAAFWLPWWVHPLFCFLLFSLFPWLAQCCAGCQHLVSYKETKGWTFPMRIKPKHSRRLFSNFMKSKRSQQGSWNTSAVAFH